MIKEALATHQRKLEFLRKRIKEGVSKTLPDEPRMTSSESWSRQRKVGFRYAFQGESTLTKLGKAYGMSTENASQLNERFLQNIWYTASPGLREKYPLGTIPPLKPRAQGLREENSETHVDSSKPKYKNLVEAVTGEDNDGKLQEILDSYSDGSLRGYLNYVHRKDLHKNSVKVLASLYRTLLEAGFHFDPKLLHLFADAIIRNGIPMRILRYQRIGEDDAIVQTYNYYAVLSKHQQRIIDVINNDPELQKYKINPVTLVCGEHNGNIPNTTKLNDKRRYGNTGHAIRTVVGYRIGGRSKVKAESLLRDCAVPILKYRNHLFYPLDREQELADFIKSKQSMFPPRKS